MNMKRILFLGATTSLVTLSLSCHLYAMDAPGGNEGPPPAHTAVRPANLLADNGVPPDPALDDAVRAAGPATADLTAALAAINTVLDSPLDPTLANAARTVEEAQCALDALDALVALNPLEEPAKKLHEAVARASHVATLRAHNGVPPDPALDDALRKAADILPLIERKLNDFAATRAYIAAKGRPL